MNREESGLSPSIEKQRMEWERERALERKKLCPLRYQENGNCLPVGGFCLDSVSEPICKAMHMAYEMGFTDGIACTKREEDEKNEPLTLDELQKMPGQPVYIVPTHTTVYDYEPAWALVNVGEQFCEDSHHIYLFEEIGIDWLAYRRPPVKEEA